MNTNKLLLPTIENLRKGTVGLVVSPYNNINNVNKVLQYTFTQNATLTSSSNVRYIKVNHLYPREFRILSRRSKITFFPYNSFTNEVNTPKVGKIPLPTIDNLSKGLIAIDYRNVKDIKLLTKILKKAFPKDKAIAKGIDGYYFKAKRYNNQWGSNYEISLLPTYNILSFKKELEKDSKYLSYIQAMLIMDNVCQSWKEKLARAWSYRIVLRHKVIKVENSLYEEMRKEANTSQNILLDDIFGKDEEWFPGELYWIKRYKVDKIIHLRYASTKIGVFCVLQTKDNHALIKVYNYKLAKGITLPKL